MQPGQLLSPMLRNRSILSESSVDKLEQLERKLEKDHCLPHSEWAKRVSPRTKHNCTKAFLESGKALEQAGNVDHALSYYRLGRQLQMAHF